MPVCLSYPFSRIEDVFVALTSRWQSYPLSQWLCGADLFIRTPFLPPLLLTLNTLVVSNGTGYLNS